MAAHKGSISRGRKVRLPLEIEKLGERVGACIARGQYDAAHKLLRAAEQSGRFRNTGGAARNHQRNRGHVPLGSRPVFSLGLQLRTEAVLCRARLLLVRDLQEATDAELLRVPSFDRKMLREIRNAIADAKARREAEIRCRQHSPNYPPSRRELDGPVTLCPLDRR